MGRLLSRIADFIRETDKLLLILCAFASFYGVLAVFSSTRHEASLRPTIVQTFCLFAGVGAALIISAINFTQYIKRWYVAIFLGVVPVILTFFIGIAPAGTDDKAWLDLGITTFQPSELMKICFIITFAAHLSYVKKNINKITFLIPVCLHGAFPVLLIFLQGDYGTALVFAVMVLIMMWCAGVSWKYFLIAFSAFAVSSPFVYFFALNDEHRARIISIFNLEADIQGDGYQQYRGRVALANGGFSGQGYLKGSLTQAGGVPEGHNDFIFVSIGEELGFLGCMVVLIILGAICLRALRVSAICRNDSGKLICVGFFAMLFAQIIINIGMCISILPVIGVTLPFFSAGGTSLLSLYLGVGLVLSVYKHRDSRTIYLHD